MKNINLWKEQTKRKLNEKETSNGQLKKTTRKMFHK